MRHRVSTVLKGDMTPVSGEEEIWPNKQSFPRRIVEDPPYFEAWGLRHCAYFILVRSDTASYKRVWPNYLLDLTKNEFGRIQT